jgi:hypothetical protein
MTFAVRDRIVRIQAEHIDRQLTNYDTGREECGCGHQGNATYREHLADAILAIPGIAVVELPGPDHHEPATEDTNGYVEWWYPHGSIATTDDGTIMWEHWDITDPSKVRAAAAALLAAADHVERDQ